MIYVFELHAKLETIASKFVLLNSLYYVCSNYLSRCFLRSVGLIDLLLPYAGVHLHWRHRASERAAVISWRASACVSLCVVRSLIPCSARKEPMRASDVVERARARRRLGRMDGWMDGWMDAGEKEGRKEGKRGNLVPESGLAAIPCCTTWLQPGVRVRMYACMRASVHRNATPSLRSNGDIRRHMAPSLFLRSEL